MKIRSFLIASMTVIGLTTAPFAAVAEEETVPQAGEPASASWMSLPVGSYVMVGASIFVVTATGLVLLDDDDDVPPATSTTTTS